MFLDFASDELGFLEKMLYRLHPFNFKKRCAKNFWEKTNEGLYLSRAHDGLIVGCNDMWAQMCGFESASEMLFEVRVKDLYVNKVRREELLNFLNEKGEVRDFEVELETLDGKKRVWLNLNSRMNACGALIEGVAKDITIRKESEEKLKKLKKASELGQQKYSNLLNEFPGIVSIVDPISGKILWISEGMIDALGYEPELFVGKNVENLYRSPQESADVMKRLFSGAGIIRDHRMDLINVRGELRHFSYNLKLFRDLGDDSVRLYTYGRDITDMIRREQVELNRKKQEARETLLENIAGGLAHEFNNMFTGILNYSDLALNKLNAREVDVIRYIEEVQKAGFAATEVVNDLLLLTKKKTDVSQLGLVDIREDLIEPYFASVVKMNKFAKDYSHVEIVYDVKASSTLILGASYYLGLLLDDLIVNAAEAYRGVERGLISVLVENRSFGKDVIYPFRQGDYVVLKVHDDGGNISSKHISELLDPFYTKKEFVRKRPTLGLARVLSIAQNCDGFVNVSNQSGIDINVYFPVVDPKDKLLIEGPNPERVIKLIDS